MTSAENYHRFCSRLSSLRWVAVIGQLFALVAGAQLLHALAWQPMLILCFGLLLANVAICRRLKTESVLSAPEAFSHLLLDVFVLSVLLYYSGGASNPFVSLYLLPVALAATVLPLRYVIALVAICTAGYSFLFLFARPMPHVHGVHGSDFDMHLAGMWLNFVVTAVLIAGFVTSLATAVRQRDASLAAASESALRQRGVIRVGALAAGAAHELGSPLSTMAMLVEDMKCSDSNDGKQADLELLGQQIDVCRHHLDRLFSLRADTELSLAPWLSNVAEQFRAVRPESVLTMPEQLESSDEQVPAVVEQALFTLLNNAADASLAAGDQRIELQASKQSGLVSLTVIDQGGTTVDWGQALQRRAKPGGRGVGLKVALSGMETIGGDILFSAAANGSQVTIRWPER
ncbi:MAG: two-component system sensor histidine kinase RegB [Gammaproteobacteria bacterium]|jgi:two-component system sensor histidine kinase RegB